MLAGDPPVYDEVRLESVLYKSSACFFSNKEIYHKIHKIHQIHEKEKVYFYYLINIIDFFSKYVRVVRVFCGHILQFSRRYLPRKTLIFTKKDEYGDHEFRIIATKVAKIHEEN